MHIYPKQVDSQLCQQDHIYEQCSIDAILTFMTNSLLKLFSIRLDSMMYKNLINRTMKP